MLYERLRPVVVQSCRASVQTRCYLRPEVSFDTELGFGKALFTLDEKLLTLVFALCFILFFVAIVAILGNCAFTFDYGPFGKRRRGPLPDEPPLRTFRNSFGIIGGVRASLPLVTWLIYRCGIGVKVSTLGDVYLPLDAIEAIELENGLSSTLYHRSPEVRGPIRVPQHVARAIAELLGPQKVIVTADLAEKANWFQRLWQ